MTGPVYVALDTPDLERAVSLAGALSGAVGGVKLGKEFFTAQGPAGVERVAACGLPLFLDLKFHDIPNTVAAAVRAALRLNPYMLNVHASGGADMMKAAVEAAEGRTLVLAVTVLTSMNVGDLAQTGVSGCVLDQVRRLAALAHECGLDGVVCSPHEVQTLKRDLGADFKLVTPGVRPEWATGNDQKRIMTPAEALAAGADYLVIGRPITGAADPAAAAERIAGELA